MEFTSFKCDGKDAKPPACDCPARKAISELLKCPDGRSLTWPEIDEICRAALSTPCPTAELRDEIEQHNLWRAEAYRQLAEKDADIAQLRKNYAQSMKSANRDIEGLMASLAALKREAAEALEPLASASESYRRGAGKYAEPTDTIHMALVWFDRAAALCERLKAEDPR